MFTGWRILGISLLFLLAGPEPASGKSVCERIVERGAELLGLRYHFASAPLPQSTWSESDWTRFQQRVLKTQRLRDFTITTSSPLVHRELEALTRFGVPVIKNGNEIRIQYTKIDWKKLVESTKASGIPFSPSIQIKPTEGPAKWLRIGIDPLPESDFQIIDANQISHTDWAKLMRNQQFPFSLDLAWHEMGHLFAYAEDPIYADAIYQFYQKDEATQPSPYLWDLEESGRYLISSRPSEFKSFLKKNRKEAHKDPQKFLEELSKRLRVYGGIRRQIIDWNLEDYSRDSFPVEFAEALKQGKSEIKLSKDLDLAELYNILHFLSDLKTNPDLVLSHDFSKFRDPESWFAFENQVRNRHPSLDALIRNSIDQVFDRLEKISKDDTEYADYAYYQIRALTQWGR